jgi:hypothetical protein
VTGELIAMQDHAYRRTKDSIVLQVKDVIDTSLLVEVPPLPMRAKGCFLTCTTAEDLSCVLELLPLPPRPPFSMMIGSWTEFSLLLLNCSETTVYVTILWNPHAITLVNKPQKNKNIPHSGQQPPSINDVLVLCIQTPLLHQSPTAPLTLEVTRAVGFPRDASSYVFSDDDAGYGRK